jgi:hypothetical protein
MFSSFFGAERRGNFPTAVVSICANTSENSWEEVRDMSLHNSEAQGGNDGTTNHDNENNLAKFKNADVIDHPASLFSAFARQSGYSCSGAGMAFMPYLLGRRERSFYAPLWKTLDI